MVTGVFLTWRALCHPTNIISFFNEEQFSARSRQRVIQNGTTNHKSNFAFAAIYAVSYDCTRGDKVWFH